VLSQANAFQPDGTMFLVGAAGVESLAGVVVRVEGRAITWTLGEQVGSLAGSSLARSSPASPARFLFVDGLGATWTDTVFNPGDVSDTSLKLGSILEFGVIVTNIATAVVLYPLARRLSETASLGYVTARIMESVFIAIGLISIITVVDVDDAWGAASGAEATALEVQGNTLVSIYDWAFQFGPGLVVGFGNGLLLGYLMYRSGLVPPRMAILGLIGGPMLILSFVLILFGVYDNGSGPSFLLALPEIAWEASLAIYCAWKGFRPSSVVNHKAATA
jgi:hypothetical protein